MIKMERVVRIELTTQTWKDCVLPLNYTRVKRGVSSGSHGKFYSNRDSIKMFNDKLTYQSSIPDNCDYPNLNLSD